MPTPFVAAPQPVAVPHPALKRRLGLIGAPLVLAILWFTPVQEGVAAQHAMAIGAMMIVLWATEAIAYAHTALIGIFLFWALSISPFEIAFSGFSAETTWFLLSAIVLGMAATKSGLTERLAYSVTARVGASYSALLLAFIVVDFLLTFLISSGIARVTALAAIVAGMVKALGLGPRSNVARGLLLIVTYAAGLFDKMIIAGSGSILARGIIQQVAGVSVPYSQWLVAYLPADAITILCCWRLILWLYPPERNTLEEGAAYIRRKLAEMGAPSQSEKRCGALLGIAVVLWMTDSIHHLNPAMIGVAVALVAVTPKVGLLNTTDLRSLNVGVVLFTAGALGMSKVLAYTQALNVLTHATVTWMTPLVVGPLSASIVLYWTAFIYHLFLGNDTTMLTSSLPAVLTFATVQGLNPLQIGMIWAFGGGGKIFAYQSGVLLVGYSYGYFDASDLAKVGLIITVLESLVLVMLVRFYWPLVGVF